MKIQKLNKIIFVFLFFSAIGGPAMGWNLSEVKAQTLDPTTWQTQATGLKTQSDANKKTGGLGFNVQDQGWPFLTLPFSANWIQLGQIKVPGVTGSFSSESVDWAHNEMTFNSGQPSQLKLTVSRLTPALLVNSSSSLLSFLAGNVTGNFRTSDTTVSNRAAAPSYPRYAAFSQGGSTQIQALSTTATNLSLDQNWILVWYGEDSTRLTGSHFIDSKVPKISMASPWNFPGQGIYQADVPILLVFENNPTSIKHSSEGGIELSFASSSGNVAILPLFGKDTQRNSVTEQWATSTSLLSPVVQKAQFWSQRLCNYPASVSETYGYNSGSDTATITESFTFTQFCGTGGIRFAPIPPFVGISKDPPLNIQFSPTSVADANLPTEFGPTFGIENTNSYSWSISWLKKYTDSKRNVGNNNPPELAVVEAELNSEVNKLISAGHMAPWIFMDTIPRIPSGGNLYWANPAETIYHLSEIIPALSDPIKTNLIDYMKSERSAYPPETIYDVSKIPIPPYNYDDTALYSGTFRKPYTYYGSGVGYDWNSWCVPSPTEKCGRLDEHQKRVTLYNFLALSRYYELTGEAVPQTVVDKAKTALDADMKEQDWATSFWFKGFEDRREAVVDGNRNFAGFVGLTKIAKLGNDSQTENLARALLAKAAVLRLSMARYPRYLYSKNLVELPSDTAWQPKSNAGGITGNLNTYSWTGAYDDPRQIATLDQFGVYLNNTSSYMKDPWNDWNILKSAFFLPFRDLTPELGSFLIDFGKQDVEVFINKVEANYPHWYLAYAEATLGSENNLTNPIDPFQIFLAKTYIQNDSAANLRKYRDISWLDTGDLFYLQKLAEVVKAYKGVTWDNQSSPTPTPIPHCQPLGNIDCLGTVNVVDLSLLISKFGGNDIDSDLDDSGKVNVIDLSILLSNFGQ